MMPPTRRRLTTLLALAFALATAAPAPVSAAPGGDHGPPSSAGAPGGNRAHGHPGPAGGGGGASPGGSIGGGMSGGVGGPTGGLGASRGHGASGGGGGGAAISPLSPNAAQMGMVGPGPSFSPGRARGHGGGGGGGGGGLSALSPNAAAMSDPAPGHGAGNGRGRGHGDGVSSLSPIANATGRDHGQGQASWAQSSNGRSSGILGVGSEKQHGPGALQKAPDPAQNSRKGADKLRPAKGEAKDDADELVREATETGNESDAAVAALTNVRRSQARSLIEAHRDRIEPDTLGWPVVRGEILAVAPTPAALARAQRAGFRISTRDSLPGLGVESVILRGPRGLSTLEALRRLRALDPAGHYDLNHLYQESGAVVRRTAAVAPASPTSSRGLTTDNGVRIGLVDGGVAARQPTLAGARIVQRSFAGAAAVASPHATAVASLMAGRLGPFRGAAPGATLYVADVYGGAPTGGSAATIARALAWLAEAGAPVINISLVGPPNILLEAAVKALVAKGHVVVAAVGNDGPAAPPLYPASYPGVIAVTGVDARRRLLPEASRGTHVDFAAPAAEMAAAGVDGGFVAVRGTSFAAPLAAGLLARRMTAPDRAAADRAISGLGRQALDLGPPGRDPLFGRGLVATELRTPPPEVGARYALRGP